MAARTRSAVAVATVTGALVLALANRAYADEPDTAVQVPRISESHWSDGPRRPFVALTADIGYLYLKPRVSFGYGKPFMLWCGIDVLPVITQSYAAGYAGLRFQVPWFDLRVGARAVHAFDRQLLAPQDSYNLVDLAEITGHAAEYLGLEAELSGAIPAGPGYVVVLGTASALELVPHGYDVYDETLHVVARPPMVYRARAGYAFRLLEEGNARLGVVGEVLGIPERSTEIYRAGLVGSFSIDDHLEAVATLIVPIYWRHSLGMLGGDYGELGLRYRWVTGHEHPR
jgi:hypothetical protein